MTLSDGAISADAEAIRYELRDVIAGLKALAARVDRIEGAAVRAAVAVEQLVVELGRLIAEQDKE